MVFLLPTSSNIEIKCYCNYEPQVRNCKRQEKTEQDLKKILLSFNAHFEQNLYFHAQFPGAAPTDFRGSLV